ncbi:MAG: hypothetical protein K6F63_00065 [Lachnospiraceae bacterium]|nr:hypothetical protein [Lachnospiraceae bacterium]
MIEIRKYKVENLNLRNVNYYMGQRNGQAIEGMPERIDKALKVLLPVFDGKVCFMESDVPDVESVDLKRHLVGCKKVLLMAATIGAEADRERMRAAVKSPVDQLIYDAVGTEAIENVCDTFCKDMEGRYGKLTSRFSPGYGDLPLEYQKDMITVLDTNRKIGVSLTDSLLMSPTKSVTAIIGIKENTTLD